MVVGDAIAGFIWATGGGEEEASFTPFAFSRSRFLCAGTMVLGRGHGKALRRAWDTYFWLLHFVFWYFLLCVHDDEGTGRVFDLFKFGYEIHAVHKTETLALNS
ncbi:hypothetical protein N431DRAFT_173386 [Stipitochalara longipes BDJ]|nr:hypothetical protein N431DRAFT_173386 [Stipitochalara longipes BDJ]